MKRLVLLGEGHGEVSALPVLVHRLLQEKFGNELAYVDRDVIRTSPAQLVRWDNARGQPDFSKWVSRITLASGRRDVGGILAVYDGDCKKFPAGSARDFCPAMSPGLWRLQLFTRALENYSP
jgi:hypothetical protein